MVYTCIVYSINSYVYNIHYTKYNFVLQGKQISYTQSLPSDNIRVYMYTCIRLSCIYVSPIWDIQEHN